MASCFIFQTVAVATQKYVNQDSQFRLAILRSNFKHFYVEIWRHVKTTKKKNALFPRAAPLHSKNFMVCDFASRCTKIGSVPSLSQKLWYLSCNLWRWSQTETLATAGNIDIALENGSIHAVEMVTWSTMRIVKVQVSQCPVCMSYKHTAEVCRHEKLLSWKCYWRGGDNLN